MWLDRPELLVLSSRNMYRSRTESDLNVLHHQSIFVRHALVGVADMSLSSFLHLLDC